jgi:hypothetical protein
MKVTINAGFTVRHDAGIGQPGETIDLSDKDAEQLTAHGIVTLAPEQEPEKPAKRAKGKAPDAGE